MQTFDNAHHLEKPHEHRYIGSEKQPPIVTRGSVNEAMHAVETKIREGWSISFEVGEHPMSAVTDKTWGVFRTASFSDDDLGYPDDVEFVPDDQEWADGVVWSNLAQGLATVVVNEESELVLLPRHRSLLDKLRGRVAVNVGLRVNSHAPAFMTASRLGRHPLREMRELSLA